MDLQLSDKTVFITGASGGIGQALAEAFAAEGARVVAHAGTNRPALQAFVDAQPWRERALVVQADVTDAAALQRAMDEAVGRFGRVDVTIANAGVWPAEDVPLAEMHVERIRRTLEVNLLGALWTARAFLRRLEPRPDGHGACLLFIGSTAGRFGEAGHVDYAASKAALRGLLLTLKNEIVRTDPWGRVNLIEPGWVATEMARQALEQPGAIEGAVRTMALRQLARPVDIARVAVMLASPAASRHVSGEVVTVAGGMEGRTLWADGEIDAPLVRRRLGDEA